MALTGPAFLDTSILLGGLIELAGPRTPAQRVFSWVSEGRTRRVQTAWHCCLEFYSVATRLPEEFRLAPTDAFRLLEAEVFGRIEVFDLPIKGRIPLLRQAVSDEVAGGRIYDAHIAGVALAARAHLVVTENRRHFAGLLRHGIIVLTAEEFVAEGDLGGRKP